MKLLRSKRGFTLIELLFSLLLFLLIVNLSLQIVMVIQKHAAHENGMDFMEWELFLTDLQWEVRNSTTHETKSNKLYLSQNNRIVSFDKYGSNIRRRVDNTGYEVMLHHVHTFTITKEEHAILMVVTDFMGKQYTAELSLYD